MKPEMFLQCEFSKWLDSKTILFCASAGGMRTNIRTAVNMKRAWYKKGFPDIFIYHKNNQYAGLAIEIKVKNRPTSEQLEWQKALVNNGYKAVIMPKGMDFSQSFNYLRDLVEKYLI